MPKIPLSTCKHWVILLGSSLMLCACSTTQTWTHKDIVASIKKEEGVGAWYYCGSDAMYHYFHVVFDFPFVMHDESNAKIRKEEFSIDHEFPFKGSFKGGARTDMITGKRKKVGLSVPVGH